MTEVETEFQSAVATARHALEQFNAEPMVASKRGGPRLSPWWRVWVQSSEVAQRWHRQREPERHYQGSAYQADDDLVFCHPHTGNPIDNSKLLKRFKNALKAAELRELRLHDLRTDADPPRVAGASQLRYDAYLCRLLTERERGRAGRAGVCESWDPI
jgi:hypothetical protein